MIPLVVLMSLAFLTLILLAVGLMMKSERQIMLERVRRYGYEEAQQVPVLTDDLLPSFAERIVRPLASKFAKLGASMTPSQDSAALAQRLASAGDPLGLKPAEFSTLRGLAVVVALGVGVAMAMVAQMRGTNVLLVLILFFCLGYFVPQRWLSTKIAVRRSEILRALPNAIDLLNVSVEAGLGFDGAIARIVDKTSGPLSDEFLRVLREMRMGKTRVESLRDMAVRADVSELSGFVAAVYQAEELGASLTTVLRVQGQMIRSKRRMRAREIAAKLPVKMLFPLIFFVFPSIFIVVIGPGVIQLARSMVLK
jgi:tight adherence protein C